LEEEALDRTVWRMRFGRAYRAVIRQTMEWMDSLSVCVLQMWLYIVMTSWWIMLVCCASTIKVIVLYESCCGCTRF